MTSVPSFRGLGLCSIVCLLFCFVFVFSSVVDGQAVYVTGHAYPFGPGPMVSNAPFVVLERPDLGTLKTGADGEFGFEAQVGDNVTIVLDTFGYQQTQSVTMVVGPGPTYGPLDELTLQVPNDLIFAAFKLVLEKETGLTLQDDSCHIVVTVAAENKTLEDAPQGEPNATVSIYPPLPEGSPPPFYFGAFRGGLLNNLTDPFISNLNQTSFDGGVLFMNVPPLPSDEVYVIEAHKPGIDNFSHSVVICRPGVFTNGGPPWGPQVNGPLQ
eukprot:TRINITY_DN1701_c0_g1_i1.p1 TRINITY_DN1701_c0_g1~~TRINITY_DN1701_c0_g1_i1.p1  ORF type:complete len:269 (-),score=45.45 TRINITY_DN1701_c0_g1_i1:251-1057(-)